MKNIPIPRWGKLDKVIRRRLLENGIMATRIERRPRGNQHPRYGAKQRAEEEAKTKE